jgi:hypothetical protein
MSQGDFVSCNEHRLGEAVKTQGYLKELFLPFKKNAIFSEKKPCETFCSTSKSLILSNIWK